MLTHAVIDALLGAAGLGDIGQHFPDTDPRYGDADSLGLLRTWSRLGERGLRSQRRRHGVLERPKLAPHREAIRATLAAGSACDRRVNVKATTGEGIGFVGRGEGAAALAAGATCCGPPALGLPPLEDRILEFRGVRPSDHAAEPRIEETSTPRPARVGWYVRPASAFVPRRATEVGTADRLDAVGRAAGRRTATSRRGAAAPARAARREPEGVAQPVECRPGVAFPPDAHDPPARHPHGRARPSCARRDGRTVGIYACGPTVYDRIHVGNARPFVVFCLLARFLAHEGYEPTLVANVTDINDKIYDAARPAGRPSAELAARDDGALRAPTPTGSGSGGPTTSRWRRRWSRRSWR